MFCPKCSQEQAAENVRFCSRCGFLLTGIVEVVKNDGIIPKKRRFKLRKKGVKQGFFMLVLSILISPILLIIAKELALRPAAFILIMFTLFISGIVRMLYAHLFEEDVMELSGFDEKILPQRKSAEALPSAQTNTLNDFVPPIRGNWRDTNDLAFSTVTDETTQQLKN